MVTQTRGDFHLMSGIFINNELKNTGAGGGG